MNWTIKTKIKNGVATTEYFGNDSDGNKVFGNEIEIDLEAYGDLREGLKVHQKTIRDLILAVEN